jgi:hypothetical protein
MQPVHQHHPSARRQQTRTVALFLAGCAAVSLTACGGPEKPSTGDAKSTASPSADATPSAEPSADPEAHEKKAVLAAYSSMWHEQTKAYAKASGKGTDLEKYATAEALSRALGDLQSLKAAGKVLQGEPTHKSKVTSIDLDKKLPDAKITDCLDVSKWKTVTTAGKTVPPTKGVLKRYITVVSAEKWGKRWMMTKVEPQRRPC